ncbi:PTS galactosamine/N-acetylgalactosamine transporter subunit IIA [Orbus wheelerorum]|uniref:PTS galactosamine/N-acetylgalactosamine transporter subunit IIA n=1 Tax=Orbus wheelerorum TaxID=3074111 RepID=UPI00370D1501
MLGIILTGHGSFATGLYDATVQIIGQQAQFMAVNFPDGLSVDELEKQLNSARQQCDQGEGVIFLTDILGGSPFRTAALISFGYANIEVITGSNLPLVIEMLLMRDGLDASTFRDMAIDKAKQAVTSLWHQTSNVTHHIKECEDGI